MEDEQMEFKSKEDFKKYKDEIVTRLAAAIEAGRPFLVIAEGEGDTMATMGGNLETLSEQAGISMFKARKMKAVLDTALKFAEHLDEKTLHKGNPFAEVKGTDLVSDIIDQLDCENCPGKDECEIYQLAVGDVKDDIVAKFVNVLAKKHPEIAHLIRAKRTPMAKGGDA